jgi:antirestriction protein ArdC
VGQAVLRRKQRRDRAAQRRYPHYTGINVLILWPARDERGYPSPRWMTFGQALDKGGTCGKEKKAYPSFSPRCHV